MNWNKNKIAKIDNINDIIAEKTKTVKTGHFFFK